MKWLILKVICLLLCGVVGCVAVKRLLLEVEDATVNPVGSEVDPYPYSYDPSRLQPMIGRRRPRRGNQRKIQPESYPPAVPLHVTAVQTSNDTIAVTFDTAVRLSGTPQWSNNDILPSVANMATDQTLLLQYPTPINTSLPLVIPLNEGSIRSKRGRRVGSGKFWIEQEPV